MRRPWYAPARTVPSGPLFDGVPRTVFKLLKYLVYLIVVLVIAAAVGGYLLLNYAVKRVVQAEGTAQLHVPTTVGSATVGLTTGGISFKDLALGSPAGFTAPQMLTVGGFAVTTPGLTHLRDKPLHVNTIALDAPHLVVEQHGTHLNFKALLDGLPGRTATGEPKPSADTAGQNPVKVVIDRVTISNATVGFVPDAGGTAAGVLGAFGKIGQAAGHVAGQALDHQVKPVTVTLPDLTIKDIGNADGKMQGVEIKDVAAAVIEAMASAAAKTANLPIDPSLLDTNLGSVRDKLGGGVQQQLDQLPGGAGNVIGGLLGGGKK